MGCPEPQPRQRHRVVRKKSGATFASNYLPDNDRKGRPLKIHAYKRSILFCFRNAYSGPPLSGPIKMDILFVMPRPGNKTWKRKPMPREWHTAAIDVDNMCKAVMDALGEDLFAIADSQVAVLCARKVLAAGDEMARTEIIIRELDYCP